jgi:exonuclease SbcD
MSHRSFTFLHAADLHLDSPLLGLTRYPGAPVDRLRNATRDAFRELVDEALQRAVDFVVLAGDVFDGDWPDYASGLWFAAQLRRLTEAGVLVYLLYGNHDAESRMTSKLRLPPGVHAFGSAAPESFEVPGFDVVLHGQSFADPCVETNLVKDYPPARAGVFNLGVLHTGLEGYEGHGRYAPCSLADLVAKGYDYWALGHVHKRQVVSQDPWIVFPGNLQGRHARELGPKGASFVRVQDGAVASVEEFACDVARWAHVEVDLDGVDDEGTALRRLEDALRDAYSAAAGRLVAARVTLRGATPLARVLRAEPHRIEAEVRSTASTVAADLWIEKVLARTNTPRGEDLGEDGIAALAARIEASTVDAEEAAILARDLPPDIAALLGVDPREAVMAAVGDAAGYLAALLDASTEDGTA